jgi:hypothetical protein
MTSLIECQICLECFQPNKIDKVACGSSVDHTICFDCEQTWRSKMPLQDGIRIMNCPTCRQPEKYRTTASLQREAQTTSTSTQEQVIAEIAVQFVRGVRLREEHAVARARTITREELDVINARLMGPPPIVTQEAVRPPRARCASGRNCRSTSLSGRTMTHLKCTHCNTVFCCRTCKECVGCRPFPSYMLPYVERLRL